MPTASGYATDRAAIAADVVRDVLLEDRGLAADAARLAHVERSGKAVRGVADDVAAQAQAGPAGAAVVARRLGLQPVQQAQAQLARGGAVARRLVVGHSVDRPADVVHLRPV